MLLAQAGSGLRGTGRTSQIGRSPGEPLRVSVLPGDPQSVATVAAVKELMRDPMLAGIRFQVYPDLGLAEADRRFLATSDLIVITPMNARAMVPLIADDLRAALAAGGRAFAIGTSVQPLVELGATSENGLIPYVSAGGKHNIAQLLRASLARSLRPGLTVAPPVAVPNRGYYDLANEHVFETFEAFSAAHFERDPATRGRPWVGVVFSRTSITGGDTALVRAVAAALGEKGLNALPVYSYPVDTDIDDLLVDAAGTSRVDAVVALSMKLGNTPGKGVPQMRRIGVPLINAMTLYAQSRAEWEASKGGLDIAERAWQLGGPELIGAVAPTVVASKEHVLDRETGIAYVSTTPIPGRVELLAARVQKWVHLRVTPPADKRVALVYYNYLPPGPSGVGAYYLNVLPKSLWQVAQRLAKDGYSTPGAPESEDELFAGVRAYGLNPLPDEDRAAYLDAIVKAGKAQLVAVSEYRTWFDTLPRKVRTEMVTQWGEPEDSTIMTWRDPQGKAYFVIPGQRWGNVYIGPQPTRGWEQLVTAVLHSVSLPPHHQYLAYYLWLQKAFKPDVMIHLGTHATHEWLPGKEVGQNADDYSELMVADIPQVYPYFVDNIGEGLQAKRRGMATIVSYMTPPFDRAGVNPDLMGLSEQIASLQIARDKGSLAVDALLDDVAARAGKMGLLKDLSIELPPGARLTEEQLEDIEHHVTAIRTQHTPFGLHTFGVAPSEEWREKTAEAILSYEPDLQGEERARRKQDLLDRMVASGPAELDALADGLAGRYVAAGPGNDPLRNPDSLPTGKNFYGFDPQRLPTETTYKVGAKLAEELLAGYRARHDGQYPDRLLFNLFDTETQQHEGVVEGQVLALMGVRPTWDARGRVTGVELIPRVELGRPRVDVTITPSGLYRDVMSVFLLLIDDAVSAVKAANEVDSPFARNVAKVKATLIARGVDDQQAERLASVRIFGLASGTYGSNIERITQADKAWNDEKTVADVYFNRMSHAFGQGLWAEKPTLDGKDLNLAGDLFKFALQDVKAVVHSRSSNTTASLDNDDFYQFLGGSALAARQVNGKTPEVLVSDLRNPKGPGKMMTLDRFMGEELRSRYLNPKWVEEMFKEGYAAGRFVEKVTDNLWGWQVTVPEAVDAAKWQEMYEVYVEDRFDLGIRQKLTDAGNLAALQAVVNRMMRAVDKNYWQPPSDTLAQLRAVQSELVPAVRAETSAAMQRAAELDTARQNRSQTAPLQAAPSVAVSSLAPSASPTPRASASRPARARVAQAARGAAPQEQSDTVQGRVIEEMTRSVTSAPQHVLRWSLMMLAALAGAGVLFGAGWWQQGRRT